MSRPGEFISESCGKSVFAVKNEMFCSTSSVLFAGTGVESAMSVADRCVGTARVRRRLAAAEDV